MIVILSGAKNDNEKTLAGCVEQLHLLRYNKDQ